MIKIIDHEVAFLDKALIASGLPMRTTVDVTRDVKPQDIARGKKLGKVKTGTGHDNYLKGAAVLLTMKAPAKFWLQFERYAFQDTVSSTSKMYMLTKVDLNEVLPPTIYPATREELEGDIALYNFYIKNGQKEDAERVFERLTDNVPQGYLSTRTITTNYLQLKTMYQQRKNHKLREWRDFCKFVATLPGFLDLARKGVE